MKIIKIYLLILIFLFAAPHFLIAQNVKDCFEINYLDFFDTRGMEKAWSDGKLDTLLHTTVITKDAFDIKVNFLIPLIISQLKEYHPLCNKKYNDKTFTQLKKLYFLIREENPSILNHKTLEEQLLWFRNDFYRLALNDSTLPHMIFTFDNGPFYGEEIKFDESFYDGNKYEFEFGTFIITTLRQQVIFSVFDKEKKHLWSRLILGQNDKPLTNMIFSPKYYFKSSLGIGFQMYADGESFRILLNNNGQLKFYFHSW